jgi:hypothetical protein
MARSILAAVGRIKTEVAHWLTPKAIEDACSAVGHVCHSRMSPFVQNLAMSRFNLRCPLFFRSNYPNRGLALPSNMSNTQQPLM